MIGVSKLLCGTTRPGDVLRYGRETARLPHQMLQFAQDKRPIVVWNMTRQCNLRCAHCYADATAARSAGELTTEEARAFIEDLAEYRAPVLLFSGGEPLMREDLFDLGEYAVSRGLRTVISTNGTLITRAQAERIKAAGFSYVGVSLDGIEATNDRFRGRPGAFRDAVEGIRNCRAVGQNVGLRFTITRHNAAEVPAIFDLVEREEIDRLCFYHLVYSGRGKEIAAEDLSPAETRAVVDQIFDRTEDLIGRGFNKDILTVDNHTDGVYLYRRLLTTDPARAEDALQLLRWNAGNSTGLGIANVDCLGNVHPDQFWQGHTLGNIRERKFSEIWTDPSIDLLRNLRNRHELLHGRCRECRYLDICNGNFRARAEAVHDDLWAPDPACYLTDEEIGVA